MIAPPFVRLFKQNSIQTTVIKCRKFHLGIELLQKHDDDQHFAK